MQHQIIELLPKVIRSDIGAFNYQAVGHTVFAVGRFLSALAGLLVAPRWILMILYICLIITSALAMSLTGHAGIAMIVLILFFEVNLLLLPPFSKACKLTCVGQSGVFSIIFAMCLRGLGSKTRMGAVVLTAATSGGAVIPVIMSPVTDSRGVRYGFCVTVAVFAFGLLLPLYATVVPAARQQVDPVYKRPDGGQSPGRPLTPKKLGRALTGMVSKGKSLLDSPTQEHIEKGGEEAPG